MTMTRRDLLIRTGQTAGALAVMPSAFGGSSTATGQAPASPPSVTCALDGQALTRQDVLAHEARRAVIVWRKLALHAPIRPHSSLDSVSLLSTIPTHHLPQWRDDLLALKTMIGSARLRELLATELALARVTQNLLLLSSFGKFSLSVADIHSNQGSAAGFVRWFSERVSTNDEAAMLIAHPDHYVIETKADGQQRVLETTGGSPLCTQFDIDYLNAAGNPVPLVPDLPQRVGGMALDGNKTIGYAFHQFGDHPNGGFRGRLSVAFPRATPRFMVQGHQWHLATEFSNWVEAYLRAGG